MSRAKAKVDSSMDDVLASIKQIIADDLGNSHDEDVLELTEELTDSPKVQEDIKESRMTDKTVKPTKQPAIEVAEMEPKDVDAAAAVANDDFVDVLEDQVESLISQDAINVSTAALKELDAYTVEVKSSIQDNTFGQKTVEDVMKEMLRPLLKEWLDAHLPSLVKWLVTEQIEKMLKSKQNSK